MTHISQNPEAQPVPTLSEEALEMIYGMPMVQPTHSRQWMALLGDDGDPFYIPAMEVA